MRYNRSWPNWVWSCMFYLISGLTMWSFFPVRECIQVLNDEAEMFDYFFIVSKITLSACIPVLLTSIIKGLLPLQYDYKLYSTVDTLTIDKGSGDIHVFDMATIKITRSGYFMYISDTRGESVRVPHTKEVETSLKKYETMY